MFRIFILVALFYGLVMFFRKQKDRSMPTQATPPKEEKFQEMVSCNVCKTYISSQTAIEKNGKFYCQEHANE
jgi:hypothetical protein